MLQDLIPTHFRLKAEEDKLQPVAMPAFEDIHYHDDEPLKFKAVFEVLPEFEVGEYKGLEVEYAEPTVTEAELDRALDPLARTRRHLRTRGRTSPRRRRLCRCQL